MSFGPKKELSAWAVKQSRGNLVFQSTPKIAFKLRHLGLCCIPAPRVLYISVRLVSITVSSMACCFTPLKLPRWANYQHVWTLYIRPFGFLYIVIYSHNIHAWQIVMLFSALALSLQADGGCFARHGEIYVWRKGLWTRIVRGVLMNN